MRRHLVQSSSIVSVGYDPPRHALDVEFIGGAVYRYFDVNEDTYEHLLSAPSLGRFVNAHIRTAYPFTRLEGRR